MGQKGIGVMGVTKVGHRKPRDERAKHGMFMAGGGRVGHACVQYIDCKRNGRSVRDVTRRFLKSVSEAILAALHRASFPDNRKWAKRQDVDEAELKPRPSIVTAVQRQHTITSSLVEKELLIILGH